jgi:two-component system, chemotaxis family, protein-glutamate methylesterase/glutaminase
MPSSAIQNVTVDHQLPLSEIGALLERLATEPIDQGEDIPMSDEQPGTSESREQLLAEARIFEMDPRVLIDDQRPGTPSQFGCPECGGVLWELHDSNLLRFRCRTGHAYSSESLLAAQAESFEGALWSALRALEEKASLTRRLVARARDGGHTLIAQRFQEQLQEAETHAGTLRNLLLHGPREGHVDLLDERAQHTGD